MFAPALVTSQEYLTTAYHPDCDYVEGELEERNVGQKDHSKLQGELWGWFKQRRASLRLLAFVEQRIRISATRYRVPDVCVVPMPEPDEQIFTSAPYIVIEILSPDDSFRSLQQRFDDYLAMGVPNIWMLDPATARGWHITAAGHSETADHTFRTIDGAVALSIAELLLD